MTATGLLYPNQDGYFETRDGRWIGDNRPDTFKNEHLVELMWPFAPQAVNASNELISGTKGVRQMCPEAIVALTAALYAPLPILIDYKQNTDPGTPFDPFVCAHLAILGGPSAPKGPFKNDFPLFEYYSPVFTDMFPLAMIYISKDEWNANYGDPESPYGFYPVNRDVRLVKVMREAAAVVVMAMALKRFVRIGFSDLNAQPAESDRLYNQVAVDTRMVNYMALG
jgi:hypothetical protein